MSRTLPTAKPIEVTPPPAVVTSPTPDQPDKASVAGGAPGVLPEVKSIHMPGTPSASAQRTPREANGEPEVKERKFRVANQWPTPVVYDGARFLMQPNKVLTGAQYDLDLLRKQGVVLEELRS